MIGPTDSALMERYALGDRDAFQELFRRYEGRAYGYFLYRTRSPERARDLYQDLFLRLHRFRQRYDPAQDFEPWFFTVAYRVYLDALRREHGPDAVLDEATAASPDADGSEALAIARERMARVMERLSADQQTVLVAAKVGGVEYAEIARDLGKTVAAVKQLASRAMRRLRDVGERG